jgi:hypothetical protein
MTHNEYPDFWLQRQAVGCIDGGSNGVFALLKRGDATDKKRRLDEGGSQTQGSNGAGSSGSTTHTEGGIRIRTALPKNTDAIEHLELRTRHLETAAYITLPAPADNIFLTGGLRATKEHKDIVDKQRKDGKTPKERKAFGGAALHEGLNWMTLCGKPEARAHYTDKGLTQLQAIFTNANSPHDMEVVFSHSQTWMQRDSKAGFIRFKMTPWYHDLEVQLIAWMPAMPNVRMEGQSAPREPRMISQSEVIDKANVSRYGN